MDRREIDLEKRPFDLGEVDIERPSFEGQEEPPKHRHHIWRKLTGILLVLLIIVGAAAGGLYWYIKRTPLRMDANGRINMLVMGVDEAANLADTIMLVSIDTKADPQPQIAVLSLPRDLYLPIPGFNSGKINSAYSYGQNFADSGVSLMQKTVEHNFDVPIHYYAAVDFEGFKKAIDTVDGIDITVTEAINDPNYPDGRGGYEPFYIRAGKHHISGTTALKYARSRQSTSDFSRAARQQQVLLALRNRVISREVLLNSGQVSKLTSIADKHVHTNLSLREITKLADLTRGLESKHVKRHVLSNQDDSYLMAVTDFEYRLVPKSGNFNEIKSFIGNIFAAKNSKS